MGDHPNYVEYGLLAAVLAWLGLRALPQWSNRSDQHLKDLREFMGNELREERESRERIAKQFADRIAAKLEDPKP